jgi:poly(A) polymerase/tRNA nucleotidyltransferase (CCA-adding enzyme)
MNSSITDKNLFIPSEVETTTKKLQTAGFEAYLIGGCVRDLLRNVKPKDWDITTNAKPEQVQSLFEHAFYENEFGTVGVVFNEAADESLRVVEVTTYRTDAHYSDARRPDSVSFSDNLEEDLKRRDFTINAIAYDPHKRQIIDYYKGQDDLKNKQIKAVGNPDERFSEDALRVIRAVRLATELGFDISHETELSVIKNSSNLQKIAIERVRDEFIRIVSCENAMFGVLLCAKLGILKHIIPELEGGIGVEQNKAHKYDVWEHNLRSLQHAASKNWSLDIRLSALFHDIGKPQSRRWSDEKKDWTFHGHDVVGGQMTFEVLRRLKLPSKTVEKISNLVRWHMFFSDPDKVTLSAARRLVRNVGPENIWDLMKLRACDRIGTGRPKEQPYRFRKYKAMIEEALIAPISVKSLKVNGEDVMRVLHMKPGILIGHILHALLEEVLDDPERNSPEYLEKRIMELGQLSEEQIKKLGDAGKQKKGTLEQLEIKVIRDKYWVS